MDLVKNYGYDTKAMSDLKVLNRAQGQLIMERMVAGSAPATPAAAAAAAVPETGEQQSILRMQQPAAAFETAPFQMRKDALTYTPFDSNFIMTKLKQADSKQTTTSGSITSNRQLDTQASKGYNIAKQGPTHSKQFWYLHRRGLM
ncbi:hypothetical protein WJX77_005088 [Trebouxia sp. C0004]